MAYKSGLGIVLGALVLSACSAASSDDAAQQEAHQITWPSHVVSESGQISFPTKFLEWPTLGAWSTADEKGVANGMHQVYASPGAAEIFKAKGQFPDGTILVKEVRGAATAKLSTGAASYATDKNVWFVMIKDKNNRFPGNALWGDGWGWALFEAKDPLKQVATDYKKDCLECHIPAKANDWIYIEAYPVLWKDGKAPVPEWLGAVKAEMTGQAEKAEQVSAPDAFAVCSSCHSIEKGKNGIGPSLAGIVGRKAGAAPSYAYSTAMKDANITWSAENLDRHIGDPKSVVPQNKMQNLFPGGVPDEDNRQAIISYLKTI